jgi:BirA family biotin operon repressor/biotin-[acetyl-CoA-carboxylase] ligase
MLKDGQHHSGEALGMSLGVSRAAIWKMIRQLQKAGLPIDSIKGRGYRLPAGVDLLSTNEIQRLIPIESSRYLSCLDVLLQVGSTNTVISNSRYGCGSVVVAEQQTAGRGRRGRPWVSPLASNIYLSVRWHFTQGIASLEGLSLAVGVALAEALAALGVDGVLLKWPNDLLLGAKKLGGVLVEIGGDVNGDCFAIVGVGLNVVMPLQAGDAIDQPWTDLASVGYSGGRNRLVASVVSHLLVLLASYQEKGFAEYRSRWLMRNALAGLNVVATGEHELRGAVIGLTGAGGLILQTANGERVLNGGEVSVRPHDN